MGLESLKHDDCHISFWDKLGICVSAICVVHCVVTPIIFLALPIAHAAFHLEEIIHIAIFFIASFVAFFAMYRGLKTHHKRGPMVYMLIGLTFLGIVSLILHDHLQLYQESLLTIVGSCFLIRAHLLNHACQKDSAKAQRALATA